MSTRPAILVDNVEKRFRGTRGPIIALNNVSFAVAAGDIALLVGANGAGKSTAVKTIAGLVTPDAGAVRVCGADPFAHAATQRHLGCLLEGARALYWRLSALENFAYLGTLKGMTPKVARRAGESLLERFGVAHVADEPLQKLSRGTQQKVALAAILLHAPRVVLLDEPFVLLDAATVELLCQLLRELAQAGCAVLVTTHQIEVAQLIAGTVIIMDEGRVLRTAQRHELLQEFALDGYLIELASPLSANCMVELHELGVRTHDAEGQLLFVPGNPTHLATVLNTVGPSAVLSIQPRRVELTEIMGALAKRSREALPGGA